MMEKIDMIYTDSHRENPPAVIGGNLGSLAEIIDKFALSLAS